VSPAAHLKRLVQLLVLEADASQMLGVGPGWIKALQGNPLIANHAAIQVVGGGIDSAGVHTAFVARVTKNAPA
jgi:hypothetical protein